MGKERYKQLTRANVIFIGLIVLALGAIGFEVFRLSGFDEASAGIASEAVLVLIVIGWTGSYLLRVITGKMTFMEQRKRYRKKYEQVTNLELQKKFDAMSNDDKSRLIKEIEIDNNDDG